MRFNILAVGKLKEAFFAEAEKEYTKRISRFAKIAVTELPEAASGKTAAEQQRIESEGLISRANGVVVILDRRGEELSSEELASYIDKKKLGGESEISFLIGGSHGFNETALKKADKVISFSALTFPHQLFRIMLLEQLYRALTISAGLPYHK